MLVLLQVWYYTLVSASSCSWACTDLTVRKITCYATQRRAGLWQRSCPGCGNFVVDLKVAERWCDVLNCLCGCWIYPMPDVILLDQRTSSFVYYHVVVVCVSYTRRSCPMRVLGLTMWLDCWFDRLAWPVGWSCHCRCQAQLVAWSPMLLLQVHDDHGHIHQSQMCNLECNVWKFECPSHCKPETTIHKSQKVHFLCKSHNTVEFCVNQLNAISKLRLIWKVLDWKKMESNAQAVCKHVQK